MLGLTLNAINVALDAFAKVTSVSVTIPISDKIILGFTSSWVIWLIALLIASADPWTSDFTIIFNSAAALSAKAESWVAKVKGLPPVLVSSALVSLNVLASFSESKTIKSSPDLAAPLIPRISTGIDGGASLTFSPLSLIKALTFPHFNPLTKKSPFLIVPDVTTTVATAPLPISILDSKTIPVALDSKSVFKSKISACRTIDSTNLSKFFLFFAEISTIKVSPDKSSAISSYSKSWFFIFCGSASGKSHLLIATTIGTFAALACFIDSIVWGLTPSSAATTNTTTSVNFDPLALISVNAAWPGVSIKVSLLDSCCIW